MSKVCFISGTKRMSGHKVSHANNKTKRTFEPNIQTISYLSELLGKKIKIKVTCSMHRSIIRKGGIDNFMLNTNSKNFTPEATIMKNRMVKSAAKKNNNQKEEVESPSVA